MVFKMKGYSYPGTSPLQKDVKMYDGNGEEVIIDDSNHNPIVTGKHFHIFL